MSYTNQTTHYGLPLPTGSDKSTWLDTNEAFQAIDSALYSAAQSAGSSASAISTLQSQMTTANSNISQNAADITAEESARTAADTAHSNAISSLNTKVGTTSMQGHGDGTITGILMDLVAGYDEFVTGHTPITLTPSTSGVNSNVTVSDLSIVVDDYLIQVTGNIRLTSVANGIPRISDGGGYRLKIGSLTAAEMAAHFPNLVTDVAYNIGFVQSPTVGRAFANSSGEVTTANFNTFSRITLTKKTDGTGLIGCFGATDNANVFVKSASTTSIGKFTDLAAGNSTPFSIVGSPVVRTLSVHVPDAE